MIAYVQRASCGKFDGEFKPNRPSKGAASGKPSSVDASFGCDGSFLLLPNRYKLFTYLATVAKTAPQTVSFTVG